jgi:hypothetical protein
VRSPSFELLQGKLVIFDSQAALCAGYCGADLKDSNAERHSIQAALHGAGNARVPNRRVAGRKLICL